MQAHRSVTPFLVRLMAGLTLGLLASPAFAGSVSDSIEIHEFNVGVDTGTEAMVAKADFAAEAMLEHDKRTAGADQEVTIRVSNEGIIQGANSVSAWPAPPTMPPRPMWAGTVAIKARATAKLTGLRGPGTFPGSRFIARMYVSPETRM